MFLCEIHTNTLTNCYSFIIISMTKKNKNTKICLHCPTIKAPVCQVALNQVTGVHIPVSCRCSFLPLKGATQRRKSSGRNQLNRHQAIWTNLKRTARYFARVTDQTLRAAPSLAVRFSTRRNHSLSLHSAHRRINNS